MNFGELIKKGPILPDVEYSLEGKSCRIHSSARHDHRRTVVLFTTVARAWSDH